MKYGPHGYLDPALYNLEAKAFAKALAGLVADVGRSNDAFIIHYKNKYADPPHPPVWMTAEVISFGRLSKWLGNLKLRADRNAIAKPLGVDEKILVSLTHHLTYIRNICAHHGRLWNKHFTVTMTVPNSPAALKLVMNHAADRQLYNTLAVLGYLMQKIAPGTDWRRELVSLIDSCPLADPEAMGFLQDWRMRAAWK
jgi:abortive infection bacteriophage resistance protein